MSFKRRINGMQKVSSGTSSNVVAEKSVDVSRGAENIGMADKETVRIDRAETVRDWPPTFDGISTSGSTVQPFSWEEKTMTKYAGIVERNDLEGGFWQLRCGDGDTYQLRGGGAALRVEGQKVIVTGHVDGGGFGIAMSGPILDVKDWSVA